MTDNVCLFIVMVSTFSHAPRFGVVNSGFKGVISQSRRADTHVGRGRR